MANSLEISPTTLSRDRSSLTFPPTVIHRPSTDSDDTDIGGSYVKARNVGNEGEKIRWIGGRDPVSRE